MPVGIYKHPPQCGFQKGHPQSNTGRTHFKKGHKFGPRFKKGEHISPKTEFKKGHTFWLGKKRTNISGNKHWHWKNGTYKSFQGYMLILFPSHPRTDKKGYVKRAILVMQQKLKRPLKKGEVVHHKGVHFPINSIKNKQDDSPENLGLFANNGKHMKFHGKLRRLTKQNSTPNR